MSFGTPAALGLLVVVPLLVVFYLLKVRRIDVEVSSTLLWDQLFRDLTAHEPWQRLRWNPLLLLQILLMLLLILALARPLIPGQATGPDNVVVLLDASASMQATDVAPSRFAVARADAERLVSSLAAGTTVTALTVGARPATLIAATTRKADVIDALNAAHASSTVTNMRNAVTLALSLLKGKARPEIDIFSDGAFASLGDLTAQTVPIHFQSVGVRADNEGITAFNVRANPADRTHSEAFVRVRNDADHSGPNVLSLYADGRLLTSRQIAVPARGQIDSIFADLPLNAHVLEARLARADDLALDNSATLVINEQADPRVLIVTAGNVFLESALRLLPVQLFRGDPKNLARLDTSGYGIVVFDGVMPAVLPHANLILLDPPDSPLLPSSGNLGPGGVTDIAPGDPLLRYVDLSGLQVLKSRAYTLPGWAHSVVDSGGHPLIFAGEHNGQKVVALSFDLHESNLPLQTSFPILMANILGYVQPAAQQGVEQSPAGGTMLIQPAAGVTSIEVRQPDGTMTKLTPDGARAISFDQTNRVGLYSVTQLAGATTVAQERFAVNLLNARESDITPSRRLPESTSPGAAPPAPIVPTAMTRDLWQFMALLGLAAMMAEWWWYHRRT